MSIFFVFVAMLVVGLLYFNLRYYFKTKDYVVLIPVALQLIILTMTVISAAEGTGTNNIFEFIYLLFGIFLPLSFLLLDKVKLKKKIAAQQFGFIMKNINVINKSTELLLDIIPEKTPEVVLFDTNPKEIIKDIEQKLQLAHRDLDKGELQLSLKTYENLAFLIDNPYLKFNYANILYKASDFDKAITYYKESLDLLNQGLRKKNNNTKKPSKSISKKLEEKEILYNMANSYFMQEKYSHALNTYQKVIDVDKDYKDALDNYIKTLVKTKNFEEAVKYCNSIIEKDQDCKYHYILAKIYFESNDSDKCVTELLKILELNENHEDSLALLAEVYAILKRTEDAIEIYNRLIKICPQDSAHHYAVGKLLLSINEYDHAIRHFECAVGINSQMFEANYNIALSFEKKANITDAVATYKEIIKMKTDFIPAYTRLWDILSRENKYFEFIEVCRNGIEKSPKEYILHFYMGVAFSKMGRYEESLDSFTNVLEINPDMKGANLYIGIALTKIKKYEEAILMFRNALLESPDDNEVFYNMSITYCLQERYDKAITSLKKAMELNPEIKDMISTDKEFECLRESEEFKVLAC